MRVYRHLGQPGRLDWDRPDDYDEDTAEWRDATAVGSAYEQQIDVRSSGHYRHRCVIGCGPWVKGPAPK